MSKYIIETNHLTKQYGTQKSVADLNIHVEKGKIYGLLGRNGHTRLTLHQNHKKIISMLRSASI